MLIHDLQVMARQFEAMALALDDDGETYRRDPCKEDRARAYREAAKLIRQLVAKYTPVRKDDDA